MKKLLEMVQNKKHWWTNKKIRPFFIAGVCIIALLLFRFVSSFTTLEVEEIQDIQQGSLLPIAETLANTHSIRASGQIESIDQVELRSEVSARVAQVLVTLGSTVRAGQTLVIFQNGDVVSQRNDAYARVQSAQAALDQANAHLESEKLRLSELQRGPRPEALSVAQATFSSAEKSNQQAIVSLDRAKEKARADYQSTLTSAATSLLRSLQVARDVLYSATSVQYTYFADQSTDGVRISEAKRVALATLFDASDAGRWTVQSISGLQGSLKEELELLLQNPDEQRIRQASERVIKGLQETQTLYEAIPLLQRMSSTDTALLITEKQRLHTEIATATAIRSSIDVQLALNDSTLQAAQAAYSASESNLAAAKEQFILAQAGATAEQLAVQEAAVRQAEASQRAVIAQLRSAQASVGFQSAQVSKTIVQSPISGKISTLHVRKGELVSPGAVVASIVNTEGLLIKTYIDSSQLQLVRSGAVATVGTSATGTVTFVSPAIDPQTKKVEVHVALNAINPTVSLVVGQYVDVDIAAYIDPQQAVIEALLPLEAVRITEAGTYAFVVEDGKAVARPVVLGRIQGTSVEVLSGLSGITHVIASVRTIQENEEILIKE